MLSETRIGSTLPSAGIPKEYRYLASVMGLPLVDGVFVSIVLSGGLSSISDAALVGLFVLGGFATVSVILSEFDGERTKVVKRTLVACSLMGLIAVTQAAIAPSVANLVDIQTFRYGAIIALSVIAIRILPFKITDYMIGPTPIIVFFLFMSLQPSQIALTTNYNMVAAQYAFISMLLSTTLCVATVLFRDAISDTINMRMMKTVTSIGLFTIGLNIAGVLPSYATSITMIGFIASVDLDLDNAF